MCSFEDAENEGGSFHQNVDSIMFSAKGLRTMNRKSLGFEKKRIQEDIPISPSTDQGSKISEKVKRGRGSNKCKEIATLEVGQKLKVTFYNNLTVGKNINLFSRHLGKIIRDRNMYLLGVSSWGKIKKEKLNYMWAAVKDKFESDDMNIHRDDILRWMKEVWNKWRGQLHSKYVKDKPIQEAIKNVPKGVEKKQWEWLVKQHFSTEKFQGGKDGNPPDIETIFFETRKKHNTLVDSDTIAKHAQIQEFLQSEPSLPSIDSVEKCFGPQTHSHVFGFGGGLNPNDLKGGTTSKAELWSKLRLAREENQSLKDRLSSIENEMKKMKQMKD